MCQSQNPHVTLSEKIGGFCLPAPYSPVAFANWFIVRFPNGITHLKVQKLTYCAYGWWLAYNDPFEVLTERPQVWRHGPVFRSVYRTFSSYGDRPIRNPGSLPDTKGAPTVDQEDERVESLLRFTLNRYGEMDEWKLSDLTHKQGTPWQRLASSYNYRVPRNLPIPPEFVRDEFRKIAEENKLFEHAEATLGI